MIGYLHGVVSHIFVDTCFLDMNGVGYRVYISEGTRLQLVEGERAMLFTYLNVRDDAFQLYGFLSEAEYDLFLLLKSVTGIGPKSAMNILSAIAPEQLRLAIASENVKTLVTLPGIGKKSAERLVLELKDKIGHIPVDLVGGKNILAQLTKTPEGPVGEVLEALTSLGYQEQEVRPLVEAALEQTEDVAALIKVVLSELGKKR